MPRKLIRFLLAGLPGLAAALLLNYALVQGLACPKPLAYALVLIVQVSLNFLLCRAFVFDVAPGQNILTQYAVFLAGIGAFRIADWALYSLIVSTTPVPFLIVQLFNVALFSVGKFIFARRLLEGA